MEKGENEYVHLLLTKGKDEPVDTEGSFGAINLPPWYDEKLFTKGQKFYTRNIFAMFVGMFCGLVAVFGIRTILKILIGTGKFSTKKCAYQRTMRTIYHVLYWHWYVFGTGSENDEIVKMRNSKIWKSLRMVRKTHFIASKYSFSTGNGFISQKDMALTQFGFMGFITLKAKYFGLQHDEETLVATIHFWRVIGSMLGIHDDFNVCTDSWDTTKPRLEKIITEIYRPALSEANNEFEQIVIPLVDGMWSFNPFLCDDSILYFIKRLLKCEGYEYLNSDYKIKENQQVKVFKENKSRNYKKMNKWNRFVLGFLITILQFLYPYKIFKWFFDFQIYLSLFLITYVPFLAYYRFGFKDSYVRVKL